MSLSQASSPEEIKRELKQQVFLAIQCKYDTRQTSQLIEDMNSIAGAIADSATDEAKSWQDTLSGCELDTTSHIMECPTSISRQDASTINKLIDKGALKVIAGSLGVPQSLLGKSDKPTSTVDMSLPQEFVESVRNKPMAGRCAGVSAEKEAQTPIEAPKAAIAVDHKRVLCFGGSMDGQSVIVDCGKMGVPFEQLIKPGVYSDEPYYLHKLIIGYDVLSKVYYFYSCKKEFKELLPQSVANTLARLIAFHKEDPMNNI